MALNWLQLSFMNNKLGSYAIPEKTELELKSMKYGGHIFIHLMAVVQLRFGGSYAQSDGAHTVTPAPTPPPQTIPA